MEVWAAGGKLNSSLRSVGNLNSAAPTEMIGGGVGYDSYLVDAQHQITIYKAACKDWSMLSAVCRNDSLLHVIPSSLHIHEELIFFQVPTQPLTYVGMFLEEIFTKLGRVLDQDLDMNLILTGLIAKLCYCPALALTLYLLSHQPSVAANVPTLYGSIEKVSDQKYAQESDSILIIITNN